MNLRQYLENIGTSTFFHGVVAAFVLLSLIGPYVGPAQATVTSRYTPSPPMECVSSGTPPTPQELGETPITGTIRQVSNDPALVEITYNRKGSENISIYPQEGMNVVASKGFDRPGEDTIVLGGPIGLTWNNSVDSHWIRYRTEGKFPQGKNWLIAPVPSHDGPVALQPAGEGYIAPNVVYLGPHSTKTVSTGCQSITAIVPGKTSLLLNVDQRLADLRFAAEALDSGHTYEEVRIFVSPAPISGEPYGYNLKDTSTIIIEDFDPLMPNSIAWLHEYVHTHQDFRQQPSAVWLQEATATYLSVRLALEQGRINPREYDMWLAFGENLNASSSLAKADFDSGASYYRGAAALSRIESMTWQANKIHIGDLVRMLNEHRNPGQSDINRFLMHRGGLNDQQARLVHQQVSTTDHVSPAYLLGPEWLPASVRIALGAIGSGPGRQFAGFLLVTYLIAIAAERLRQKLKLGLKAE